MMIPTDEYIYIYMLIETTSKGTVCGVKTIDKVDEYGPQGRSGNIVVAIVAIVAT